MARPKSKKLTSAQLKKYKKFAKELSDTLSSIMEEDQLKLAVAECSTYDPAEGLYLDPWYYIEGMGVVLRSTGMPAEIVNQVVGWAHNGAPKKMGRKRSIGIYPYVGFLVANKMISEAGVSQSEAVASAAEILGISSNTIQPLFTSKFLSKMSST